MIEIRADAHTIAGLHAGKYIRSLRNVKTKNYARAYLLYILKDRCVKPPRGHMANVAGTL